MNARTPLRLLGAALLCLFAGTSTQAKGAGGEDTPSQWRVIWREDPAHSATFSWSTALAGEDHRVLLSESSQGGDLDKYSIRVKTQVNGEYSRDPGEVSNTQAAWYHHATVENLLASTTYWFVMVSDGVPSAEFHFVTAPEDDRPFKLIYGGDSRSGHEARQQVNELMGELASEDLSILGFAHGGDYVLNGRLWDHWGTWLDHQAKWAAKGGRLLPIIPVRGNHDVGPLYDEIFAEPGGAGVNYYMTQLGPEAVLLTLNSEISTTGDQALWLEEALEALRPNHRWLLAQFHRPLYPAVKTPGAAKSTWVPLFEAFDLDLVLESDGHVIKRTVPIRNEKHDPTGVTYIGEGGLGVPQRTPDSDRWYLKSPGMTGSGHHVTILEFSPEQLVMRTVGLPLDASQFVPEGHASIVAQGETWSYLAGEDPEASWTSSDYDDSAWPTGPAGFGFGDEDDATLIEDMKGNYSRVYVRHRISPEALKGVQELALMIRHDDGFVAYINGQEFARGSIDSGAGAEAQGVANHEVRDKFSYHSIPNWREAMDSKGLLIAIEGHNNRVNSSDFSLDPFVVADPKNLDRTDGSEGFIVIDEHALQPRDL